MSLFNIEDQAASGRHWIGGDLISPGPARPSLASRVLVRCFDLVVASTALAVLAPLMLAIAAVVKLTSAGPVLYRSPRIGYASPEFAALKFRSMRVGADKQLGALLATDPVSAREYQTHYKLRADPRVTRVGALLRRTSLDELPQLLNIIRGEMSVVGPRPKLLGERATYGGALPIVLRVKPGLTGLWQVSGRHELTVAERVALDVRYATGRTFAADVAICVATLGQLWRPGRNGAW